MSLCKFLVRNMMLNYNLGVIYHWLLSLHPFQLLSHLYGFLTVLCWVLQFCYSVYFRVISLIDARCLPHVCVSYFTFFQCCSLESIVSLLQNEHVPVQQTRRVDFVNKLALDACPISFSVLACHILSFISRGQSTLWSLFPSLVVSLSL